MLHDKSWYFFYQIPINVDQVKKTLAKRTDPLRPKKSREIAVKQIKNQIKNLVKTQDKNTDVLEHSLKEEKAWYQKITDVLERSLKEEKDWYQKILSDHSEANLQHESSSSLSVLVYYLNVLVWNFDEKRWIWVFHLTLL